MISTFLAEHYDLTRWATVVMMAVAVLVAVALYRLDQRGRRVAAAAAIVGVAAMLLLVLLPDGPQTVAPTCNLTPDSLVPVDVWNVALFFVPALFATVAARRPLLVAAAVPLTSAAIEIAQWRLPLDRVCDIDDWIVNVGGGLAGVLAAVLAARVARSVDGGVRRMRGARQD